MIRWVLYCNVCHERVEGEGRMWHTTQPFMCDACTIQVMEGVITA